MKPKVYVTREIFAEALAKIREVAEVEVWPEEGPPPYEVLREKVRDVEGLFSLPTDRVDEALLAAAPRLKVVSNMAVGYDNIDIAAATRRGIPVGHTPGVLTETTADFAFALILAAARRVAESDRLVRRGGWRAWGPMTMLGQDVHHATLGLVGLGRIGGEVARRARAFSMRVLYYDSVRRSPDEERELGVEYVSELPKLLAAADFVSVHVPLLPETRHLIGAKEFTLMKPTAVFVNTSRGPVVDQRALYQALKGRRIFAAAIDVTEIEPIPMDDPLLSLDNVTIAPHIASASFATRARMAMLAVENLIAGLEGRTLPHCVNAEALKKVS